MPLGDLPNTSSTISFSQIQTAYNEVHETNLTNPISMVEFNGKFLENSITAISIGTGNAYALNTFRGRHFAVGSYSSGNHVIGELTEPGSGTQRLHGHLTGSSNTARIKVSVDNATDTFKVYLENVTGHGAGADVPGDNSPDCRIGLIQVTNSVELLATADGDADYEVLEYKPSTGDLYVYNGDSSNPEGGTNKPSATDVSGKTNHSTSALDFYVVVTGYGGTETGTFDLVRVPDVAASSNFTLNFFLIDSYGDGWNGGLLTIQDDDSSGAYKTIQASSLSGVAPGANGGITLSSGAGSSSSTAGSLDIPTGTYFITVTDGLYPSEITWSLTDHDGSLVSFGGSNTPPPGTFTLNVNSSGVGAEG